MTDESDRLPEEKATDEAHEPIHAQYEWSSTPPSTAVIETVAIALNCEPTSIGPLYESVNPDALDALLQSNRTLSGQETLSVCFKFADQLVTVHGTGKVVVRSVKLDD